MQPAPEEVAAPAPDLMSALKASLEAVRAREGERTGDGARTPRRPPANAGREETGTQSPAAKSSAKKRQNRRARPPSARWLAGRQPRRRGCADRRPATRPSATAMRAPSRPATLRPRPRPKPALARKAPARASRRSREGRPATGATRSRAS